ncbi:guided entry of tail-anchored proteins factor 1 isoform X1 [Petromyzon marinus]|uniref:Guided entry of tail-anchored proteins factor 1 n=1 Tax=Petromyzon marinus TaxID=7757 RepID=A0AAJ7U5G0_PETMA|nr:tail-anchored protein insertion receptor WRB isoform X1 [Petromyzon marinus]
MQCHVPMQSDVRGGGNPPTNHLALAVLRGAPVAWFELSRDVVRLTQPDSGRELELREELRKMRRELATISVMDEFARYARLERRINKASDELKTSLQARTTQLTTMKWIINISFYTLQAVVMITLIWNYYSTPVAMLPSKWVSPLEKLVAFPTGVPGGIGITCWLLVCNKIAGLLFQPFT